MERRPFERMSVVRSRPLRSIVVQVDHLRAGRMRGRHLHQHSCRDLYEGGVSARRRIANGYGERVDESVAGRLLNRPGIVFRGVRGVANGRIRFEVAVALHAVRARIVRLGLGARDSIPGASTTQLRGSIPLR